MSVFVFTVFFYFVNRADPAVRLQGNKDSLSGSKDEQWLAYEENPLPQTVAGKCGRKKRGKVIALIDRLKKYKREIFLFLENLKVPCDNNQAERDIRNIKVKTKVSGCFRSFQSAQDYLDLMSFIGSSRKLGCNSFNAVKFAVVGQP